MKNTVLAIVLAGAFVLTLSTAQGLFAAGGQEVLDKVEDTLTAPKDMEALFEMTLGNVPDQGGQEKRTLKIWTMGKNKRVVKFITPSSINNVGVLALNDEEMYVYLPAYQKSRRIQGDMRDSDFQGTDFSYREMGSYNYSKDYEPSIVSEDKDSIVLNLAKKASSDVPYDKLVMTVDKSNYLPKTVDMYAGGVKKKELTVLESEKKGDYWTFKKIRMENFIIKHYTEIAMKETAFDQDLDGKGVFTQRFLKEYVK
jgi:outer membrane lipoprotein-sorting protein